MLIFMQFPKSSGKPPSGSRSPSGLPGNPFGYDTTRGFVLLSLFWVSLGVRDNEVCLSGWVWVFLHYFPSSFSISSTCQVGHLDLEISLSHISSNFCDVFCWTLHPPRAVVCRPRQTREDVHILVATIQ